MSAAATIALNRFGYGARPGEAAPADPRGWLLGQLRSYQPRPAALATVPGRSEIAAQIGEFIEQTREDRTMRRRTAKPSRRR